MGQILYKSLDVSKWWHTVVYLEISIFGVISFFRRNYAFFRFFIPNNAQNFQHSVRLPLLVTTGLSEIESRVNSGLDNSLIDNKDYAQTKFDDLESVLCQYIKREFLSEIAHQIHFVDIKISIFRNFSHF